MKKFRLGLVLKTAAPLIFFGLWIIYLYFFKGSVSEVVLSKNPESFSELYFTDHAYLPKRIELETQYRFEFSVLSLENKDFLYDYEVAITDKEDKIIIATGSFPLKHGEFKITPVIFSIPEPFERKKINVSLLNRNQEIFFWVQPVEKI